MHAHQNYDHVMRTVSSRGADAAALGAVIHHIETASDGESLSRALAEARDLWTRCGVNAMWPDRPVPVGLREGLVKLALSVVHECESLIEEGKGDPGFVVGMSRQVLAGLVAAPEARRVRGFHPKVNCRA